MVQLMTLEELGEPEIVAMPLLRVVGTTAEYTMDRVGEIQHQWKAFIAELEALDNAPRETYGVILGERGRPMLYTCGIAEDAVLETPTTWETVEVPPCTFAVFKGNGGVDLIQRMWPSIWQVWVPSAERHPLEGPMVEFYSERFTAEGGAFEIRIPMHAE